MIFNCGNINIGHRAFTRNRYPTFFKISETFGVMIIENVRLNKRWVHQNCHYAETDILIMKKIFFALSS